MARKPFFSRSILGNVEIFAVIGIFSLYFLEFIGIHTVSQLFPEELQEQTVPALSVFGEAAEIQTVLIYTLLIHLGLTAFLIFLYERRKIKRRIRR